MRAASVMFTGLWLVGFSVSEPAFALEGDGFSAPENGRTWSRWQARVSVQEALPAWRGAGLRGDTAERASPRGLHVMADFYLGHGPLAAPPRGFRATGGLLIGARSTLSLADSAVNGLVSARGRGVDSRASALAAPLLPGADAASSEGTSALPYVGIGYSSGPARGAWGFSADLGLLAAPPSAAVKLGRAPGSAQSLDDTLRDLRLSPALQLGVSYSF